MSDTIQLVEVAPRDGLQDVHDWVPTQDKVEFVRRLAAAGVRRAEIASFAHPRVVPQMADAEAVIAATVDLTGLTRSALVLNERGLDRAFESGIDEINVVVLVSETFSQRNQGMSVAEAVASWSTIGRRAAAAGLPATVTLSAAFGCPFEGEVPPARLLEIVDMVAAAGPSELCLADTIGAATPPAVAELVGAAGSRGIPLRVHLHDTRGVGIANSLAAIQAGVSAVDSSLGGLGGCPFDPEARGNVATEDLVWCLERSGVRTGIDLDRALDTVGWMAQRLPVSVVGRVHSAGVFP